MSEDGARVRFPPPVLPVATITLGLTLQRVWPLPVDVLPEPPLRWVIGGTIVVGAMLVLGLWPVVMFRRSGQSEIPWRPTPSIIIQGPYRFTRNPMYLQMVLGCLGFSVLLASPWIALLTPLCAAALQHFAIRPEEAYLEEKFGDAYRAYKAQVRRWI